ncbi:hypothetical protein LR004_01085 [Candidatus Gracilibacteria bacterium]|nr:hypothetical protein [Candidatus Gracilibacteria bacterium]
MIEDIVQLVGASEFGRAPIPLEELSDACREEVKALTDSGPVCVKQFTVENTQGEKQEFITAVAEVVGTLGEPILP